MLKIKRIFSRSLIATSVFLFLCVCWHMYRQNKKWKWLLNLNKQQQQHTHKHSEWKKHQKERDRARMGKRNGKKKKLERTSASAHKYTHNTNILSLNSMLSFTCAMSTCHTLLPNFILYLFNICALPVSLSDFLASLGSIRFLLFWFRSWPSFKSALSVGHHSYFFFGSIFPLVSFFFSIYLDFSLGEISANINSSYTNTHNVGEITLHYNFYAHKFFWIFKLSCSYVYGTSKRIFSSSNSIIPVVPAIWKKEKTPTKLRITVHT